MSPNAHLSRFSSYDGELYTSLSLWKNQFTPQKSCSVWLFSFSMKTVWICEEELVQRGRSDCENTLLGASRFYPQVKKPFVWSELNSSLGVVLYMLESISSVFWSPTSGIHVNSWVWSEQSVHLFSSLLSFRNLTQSDVHIPNICGSSREALPLTHGLRFYGNRVLLLSLSETGLQQRLDLLLARPQTVLKGEEFRLVWLSLTARGTSRSGVPTGSLRIICASCSVSFWDTSALPTTLICKPSTAATMLPAATMDGGLAMNFTSV